MKIGFVLDDTLDKTDGVQQYVLTVGEYLKSQGHNVHYLTSKTERTDITNIHSLGRYISTRFNNNNVRTPLPVRSKKIDEVLQREKFDVLHVQMPYSPFLAAKLIKQAPSKTAVIGTFHILPASKLHGYSNTLLATTLRSSLKRFDQVVCVSAPAGDFAKIHYGVDSIEVPNAVNLSAFVSGKRRADLKDKKNIVFLGRFVKRKGVWELLNAAHAFYALYPHLKDSARFVFCGGGPLEEKVHAKAKELQKRAQLSEDSIVFTGRISEEDKPNYLASADVAVFPSLSGESFGIVLIEAIASGAGVVLGGNNPGYSSVLQDEPLAIFDPRSPESFAERLHSLITDEILSDKIAQKERNTISKFDVPVVAAQLVKIYEDAVKKRAKL